MSPTSRTLKELKKLGLTPWIVERFIGQAGKFGKRVDLFNIIDIIAIGEGEGIIGVQTTGTGYSEHYKKLTVEKREECLLWLASGGRLQLWGWRKIKKVKANGKKGKAMVYQPRFWEFSKADFDLT